MWDKLEEGGSVRYMERMEEERMEEAMRYIIDMFLKDLKDGVLIQVPYPRVIFFTNVTHDEG